jgi:hypothetical protein
MREKRPSAPMVLSIIAVVFSLAGTGAASVATISVLNKQEKKQTRKIAKKEIRKAAPGLSVANATNAQNATNANNLGGQPASFYAPATTLRTALVDANGTVDGAHSDGVSQANVTQPVPGVYCFNGLSPAPRTVVASHAGGTANISVQIQIAPTGGVCAGSQFDVATLTAANNLDPEPFTVFIH